MSHLWQDPVEKAKDAPSLIKGFLKLCDSEVLFNGGVVI